MAGSYAEQWRAEHPNEVWNHGLSCSLCHRGINARANTGPDGLFRALKRHQERHPEWAEYQASIPSMRETADAIRKAIHKNCNNRAHPCSCLCGCEESIPCDCWGDLCTVCGVRDMRGDREHGIYSERAASAS